MDSEQPKGDCTTAEPSPTPASQSKKPSQALYVPKQRLPASKDKAQNHGEVKPRPRPRYTDKARKNAKNKKDKAGPKATPAGGGDGSEVQNGDNNPEKKEERLQATGVETNGQADSTSGEAEVTSRLEAASSPEKKEEEESWDTLFNDDGDCLDPHLLEEVRN